MEGWAAEWMDPPLRRSSVYFNLKAGRWIVRGDDE